MTADLVPVYEEYTELELNSNWESQRCLESAQNGEKLFPALIPQGLGHSGHSQVCFSGCRSIRNPSCVLPSPPCQGWALAGSCWLRTLNTPQITSSKTIPYSSQIMKSHKGPWSPNWIHVNQVWELLNSLVSTLVRMGMGRTHYPAQSLNIVFIPA